MPKNQTQPDALLHWMGNLADAARLRLLRVLEGHELGVAELCQVLQMPQSTVSRHLKLLSDDGWVVCHRHGTANLYRMILGELDPPARQLWLVARQQTEQWAATGQDKVRLAEALRQRQGDAQSFFASAAGKWQQTRDQLYGQGFSHGAITALLPATWTIADLGCGTGDVAAHLARSVRKVIGVDNSPAMLKAARKNTCALANVDLRQGDLEAIPIDDDEVDAALILLVLTYLPDPSAALAQVQRIVRPGGKAVIVDLLRHDRDDFRRQLGQHWLGFDPEQLKDMLTDAGLENARCESLPPDPDAKGPALLLATATKPQTQTQPQT